MLLFPLKHGRPSATRPNFRQAGEPETVSTSHASGAMPAIATRLICATWFVAVMLTTGPLPAGVVNTFADINSWTGSGANQAALVIDWADGRDALVWGYRFNSATSSDMVRAVVEADPRLFAKVEQFSFGQFVHGLGYDRNGSGFAISSGTNFGSTGFTLSGAREGATASDTNDSYRETDFGFSMTWSFWTGAGNNYPGAGWGESQVGISDQPLSNLNWNGFRFNTPGTAPGVAMAAVPEPHAIGWLALGLAFFRVRRRTATFKVTQCPS